MLLDDVHLQHTYMRLQWQTVLEDHKFALTAPNFQTKQKQMNINNQGGEVKYEFQ